MYKYIHNRLGNSLPYSVHSPLVKVLCLTLANRNAKRAAILISLLKKYATHHPHSPLYNDCSMIDVRWNSITWTNSVEYLQYLVQMLKQEMSKREELKQNLQKICLHTRPQRILRNNLHCYILNFVNFWLIFVCISKVKSSKMKAKQGKRFRRVIVRKYYS